MKKRIPLLAILLLGLPAHLPAAPGKNPYDSILYYEIGGASAVPPPASRLRSTARIGGKVVAGAGYSCGKFDPKLGVENILNGLEDTLTTIKQGIYGAVAALPGGLFCRAKPVLCQLLQHYTVRAEEAFRVNVASCEQMERAIAAGENPFKDWQLIAKSFEWKTQAAAGKDPVAAKKAVDRQAGEKGIPWLRDRPAGGRGQPPIEPVADATRAGWCILHGQPAGCKTAPTRPGRKTRLENTWPIPDEAAAWITDVIGDQEVRLYDGATPVSRPGAGLLPKVEAELPAVRNSLAGAVQSQALPDETTLAEFNTDHLVITPELIRSIRALSKEDQAIVIDRLASEIATARVIDKALLARRLLLTGGKEPHIAASGAAQTALAKKAIPELEREIKTLLFERQVRKDLVSTTAGAVLARHQAMNRRPVLNYATPRAETPLDNGAVKIEEKP